MKFLEFSFLFLLILKLEVFAQVEKAKEFLRKYNKNNVLERQHKVQILFTKYTNITNYNTMFAVETEERFERTMKKYREEAASIDLKRSDYATKRQFKLLLNTISPKDSAVISDLLKNKDKMKSIFQKASIKNNATKIKKIPAKKYPIIPLGGISYIMKTSTDPEELLYVWEAYRDAIGPNVNDYYTEYVKLNNIGARENGYKDAGEYKKKLYEVEDLEKDVEEFWNELKPFYEELHAYVRFRLKEYYPSLIEDGQPIPAHVLGNIKGYTLASLYPKCVPYPGEPLIDVTKTIKEKMNVTAMFKTAEDFFRSIGWKRLPQSFWNNSMLEKPKDRKVICHPAAYDLYGVINNEKDVRISMCAEASHLPIVHHEVGHVYYYMLYWNQPIEFRKGANPAFHEAVGDTIALSVQTPQHLQKIGLLKNVSRSKESDINFLFKSALNLISEMPYAYIMDRWVWNVYNGKIKPEEYNKAWWEMRMKYQGIKAPSTRKDGDMDIATAFHITSDVPFIRYFLSTLLQFVFQKHACKAAHFKGNLHECSIYQSKEAGKAFGDMLALGRSKPWPEALKKFTGSEKISAEPIMEYFSPLRTWLKQQQEKHHYSVGWRATLVSKGEISGPTMMISIVLLIVVYVIS